MNSSDVSDIKKISFSYFAMLKYNSKFYVNKRLQNYIPISSMFLVNAYGWHRYSSTPHLSFSGFIRNKFIMTINIFALKGEPNGKIVHLCFFFVGYDITIELPFQKDILRHRNTDLDTPSVITPDS